MTDEEELYEDDCLYIAFSGVDEIPPRIYKDYEEFMKYCKERVPFIGYEYVFNGVEYIEGEQMFFYTDVERKVND